MSEAAQQPLTDKHVYYLKTTNDTPHLYITVKGIMDPRKTLVDSGSSRNFIDIAFARKNNIPLIKLQHSRGVIGINGEELPNKIRFRTKLEVNIEGRISTI